MKLRGPVPNFYIHVSVIYLYIPTIGLPILLYCVLGPIVIYKSRTECRNWERDRAVSFLRIFFTNFRYIAFEVVIQLLTLVRIQI